MDWRRASCLSIDKQGLITGPFLVDEVQAAINGLNAESAPGQDGIPVFFYRDYWDRVAPDLMALMDEFHAGSARMDNINRAYIALLHRWEILSYLLIQQLILNHRQSPSESPQQAAPVPHQSSSVRLYTG